MRLAAQYSFKNGLVEITKHHRHALAEVKNAITSIEGFKSRTQLIRGKTEIVKMPYSVAALNKAFQKELYSKGWKNLSVSCEYPTTRYLETHEIRSNLKGTFRDIDFVKDGLGVEFQFGKPSAVCSVCAKMTIFRNLGHIDGGVEIVPVKAFADDMSTGVSYFEQFVWDLESRGVADIDVPVLILGIDA